MSPSTSTDINVFPPNHHFAKDNPNYSAKSRSQNDILPTIPDELIRALDHRQVLEHQLETYKYNVYMPSTLLFDFIHQQLKETMSLKAQIQHLKTFCPNPSSFRYHHKNIPHNIKATPLSVYQYPFPQTEYLMTNKKLRPNTTKVIWEMTCVPPILRIAQNSNTKEQRYHIND